MSAPSRITHHASLLGVVILGAGASTRMGRPKLLLPWGDSTVVGHLIWQWRELGATQIAIVMRPEMASPAGAGEGGRRRGEISPTQIVSRFEPMNQGAPDIANTQGTFLPLLGERAGLSRQSAATAEVRADSFHTHHLRVHGEGERPTSSRPVPVHGEGTQGKTNDPALGRELDRLNFPASDRIVNPQPERGMFSSIACAARWPGWGDELTHWAVALGDQPHLRMETLRRLLDFSARNADAVCQPAFDGHAAHPVILPRSVFDRLKISRAATLKEFLKLNASRSVQLVINDPGLALDMDTPEDYIKVQGSISAT